MRLYCLPYSGASAMVYARWRRDLADIDVCPVELPGRGRRFNEPFADDMHALANQLAEELHPDLAGPYALFGHSLGALLAHELAHALVARGAPAPALLLASGTAAPALRDNRRFVPGRSDAELIDELRALKGTPEELLANDELMRLALPVLRADFDLCGRYRYRPRPPLECPLHVFGGREDDTTLEQLSGWATETRGGFALSLFEGGHFFIHDQARQVLAEIRAQLLRQRARLAG